MYSDLEIKEKMNELAKRRRIGNLVLLAGIVCMVASPFAGFSAAVVAIVLASIFLLIIGAIVYFVAQGKLKDLISDTLVPEALNRAFSQVEYQQEHHIPKELIEAALVQHYWESTGGNDYVSADYRGIPIEFSDMRLTYETGTGDKRRTRSAFRGQWLICSLATDFQAEVLLINRKIIHWGVNNTPNGMHPISSDHEALDKKFLILADDRQGAQAVLTSQAAEGVLRLHEYTKGCISLKITRDGKAHAAINSGRNIFEPGKRLKEAEQQIAGEIAYLTDVIDILRDALA